MTVTGNVSHKTMTLKRDRSNVFSEKSKKVHVI